MGDESGPGGAAGNAFDREFLDLLEELDETDAGSDTEYGGPWKIETAEEGYALLRAWEGAGRGDAPEAHLATFHDALRFFAVLPSLARDPRVRMAPDRQPDGFMLQDERGRVGRMRLFNDELLQAFHVADCVTRSPLALSALLLAAGPQALREVGRILRRAAAGPGSGAGVLGLELRKP
jgi:hypothetical protein